MVVKNPNAVGTYIIWINVATVIYFSFKNGIKGGLAPTLTSVVYYFWVIWTRKYSGSQLHSGISLTIILGVLYFVIAVVVGYLRQKANQAITLEKEARKKLEKILEKEQERERRKDDFMNMSSHELKTPITSMLLYLDLLIEKLKKSETKETVHMAKNIKTQTVRLQNLVEELLDVSRASTGKITFHSKNFRLDTLLEETVNEMQSTSIHTLILINDSHVVVHADENRIRQVIVNLINNAIKYSPGADRIDIRLITKRNSAIISIRDFGIGVKKKEMNRLFEKLYQGSGSTSGLGIGLYLSKVIIKKHKGKIWIQPEKKGTTFLFSLPYKKTLKW